MGNIHVTLYGIWISGSEGKSLKKKFTDGRKITLTFRFFGKNSRMSDILAEPPFDWFINLLRLSIFSYQEENTIITALQSVTI